jgi:hypothetical protein
MGYLSQQKSINDETVCEALLRGSVVASFGVEAFSLNRLAVLKKAEIEKRLAELKTMIRIR